MTWGIPERGVNVQILKGQPGEEGPQLWPRIHFQMNSEPQTLTQAFKPAGSRDPPALNSAESCLLAEFLSVPPFCFGMVN